MECCDWQTFEQGFLTTLAENRVPSALADWKRARRDWKRYACTGHESALMQVRRLREEGEYVRMQPNPRNQRPA